MALCIRSFRVEWLAYVDPAVYRGFRVALTEAGRDPQWGAVHWANVLPDLVASGRYSYDFMNVTLEVEKSYTAWVQVLGDGLDSIWEGVSNIQAPDDGVGLLFTLAAAELWNATIGSLQGQIDGEVSVWFGDGPPTLSNYPAEDWTTIEQRNDRLGDVYYDQLAGQAYKFSASDGAEAFVWAEISDSSYLATLAKADKALGSAQIFVTDSPSNLPNPPYKVNDLWLNGTDIMVCVTAAASGVTPSMGHWAKKTAYMDTSMSGSAWAVGGTGADANDLNGLAAKVGSLSTMVSGMSWSHDVSVSLTLIDAATVAVIGTVAFQEHSYAYIHVNGTLLASQQPIGSTICTLQGTIALDAGTHVFRIFSDSELNHSANILCFANYR